MNRHKTPFAAEFSGLLPAPASPSSCILYTLRWLGGLAPTRKIICCGCIIALMIFSAGVFALNEKYVFADAQQQKEFDAMISEFRCVTCPNQTIFDSNAMIAKAMEEEIYQRFKRGESKETIQDYLLSRYGEYVTYNPPVKKQNYLLWFSPFVMLIVGFLVWISCFRKS